jgi:hypothetical protein
MNPCTCPPTISSRSSRLSLALTGACLALTIAAVTTAAAPRHLTAERVALAASWKAPLFVQADAAGRVMLLRSDTLEVYPLTPKGTLGTPSKLERLPGDEAPFIREAALSPDGGAWLLLDVAAGPRLFHAGKEVLAPELGWRPAAVALPRGQPMVAVFPVHAHEVKLAVRADGKVVVDAKEPPPLLVGLAGSEWQVVVREEYEFGSRHWHEADARMRLERGVRLAGDAKGGVWLADEYGYRLRSYSPAGQLRAELTVGSGKVAVVERSSADIERRLGEVAESTGRKVDPVSVRFTAARAVDGLAAGRDGRIYLLVEAAGGRDKAHLAIDRFDPNGPSLERLALGELDAIAGRISVASGRDGLYVAAFSGQGGIWRLPWEQLEEARWERVPEAKLDGHPLPPAE